MDSNQRSLTTNAWGLTPLSIALNYGQYRNNMEAIQLLAGNGVVAIVDGGGRLPLHRAESRDYSAEIARTISAKLTEKIKKSKHRFCGRSMRVT